MANQVATVEFAQGEGSFIGATQLDELLTNSES